ncbi:glycosyltransferase [Paenibacillus sp. FSL H8-0537]|uniref:GAP1-N2 domain-containing protein n=1 Tax=Paenibacillus sp. FSL H8-0537 TaxID=2921399 RepID=UPI0031014E64
MKHSTSMIGQQLYTRERRGIFRSTEGYDTVAKSEGLDQQFVKKQLHPLCVYDAPAELAASGEKDGAAYPETAYVLRLEGGEAVVGRSVYQAVDFTGLRSAFFTHNYVIPAAIADADPESYKAFLGAAFVDSYDIEEGMELPDLAALPQAAGGAWTAREAGAASSAAGGAGLAGLGGGQRAALAALNISEQRFKQLLLAVMASVGGRKKVYVALDVPIGRLPEQAKALLAVLYASLPYAFRKQLGFMTFAKEPQSRKGIHLTFVEKGSLRAGDRNVDKDYTFDFVNDRFLNVDLDKGEHPYLDFAWSVLDEPDRAERFYQFAEEMLSGMGQERLMSPHSYHELSVLFQVEEGSDELYETHKSAVLRGMLEYLQPAGALAQRIRMNDLFLSRFDYEFDAVRDGRVPEPFIAESFKDYYHIDSKYNGGKIVDFFIRSLLAAQQQGQAEAMAAYYGTLESDPLLLKDFVSKMLANGPLLERLLLPFLDGKLRDARSAKDIIIFMGKWGKEFPAILDNDVVHKLVRQQLKDKLMDEEQPVQVFQQVHEQLDKLSATAFDSDEGRVKTNHLTAGIGVRLFELELVAYRTLLTELDLDRLSQRELLKGSFLEKADRLEQWNAQLTDPRQRSTALIIKAAYDWFFKPLPKASLFAKLSPVEIDRVQQLGRRWMLTVDSEMKAERFEQLVLAFYRSSDMETIDYAGLLDTLRKSAGEKELIYQFFAWSERHEDFMRPRGFVPAYATAITNYFRQHDRDAFKSRANRNEYFSKAGPRLQAVYKQVRGELSSPLAKMFRQNRKPFLFSIIIAFAILMVGIGGLLALGGGDEPEEGVNLPGATGSPGLTTPGAAIPDTLVYAAKQEGVDGKQTTTLVFRFTDAAICSAFSPETVAVVAADRETKEYSGLTFIPSCSAAPAETPAGSGTDESGASASPGDSASPTPTATSDAAAGHTGNVENAAAGTADDGSASPGIASPSPDAGADDDAASSGGSSANPGGTGTSEPGSAGSIAQPNPSDYPNRVVVDLGEDVELLPASKLKVGSVEYTLSEPFEGAGLTDTDAAISTSEPTPSTNTTN